MGGADVEVRLLVLHRLAHYSHESVEVHFAVCVEVDALEDLVDDVVVGELQVGDGVRDRRTVEGLLPIGEVEECVVQDVLFVHSQLELGLVLDFALQGVLGAQVEGPDECVGFGAHVHGLDAQVLRRTLLLGGQWDRAQRLVGALVHDVHHNL
eukprot:CAMPEP_0116916064 /NCGR_PEP_ID=MMETSP0467-20121206/18303_1 /TAXON_ID=283647 /ORGANISM="Mesodinium pulex, Strain SPMC105" /LENGTH=152 /DNA_ID=CAMNT_0004592851 /DNA_START=325 /DNA_END=783 /DNA_ORIENTATION=-